MAMVDPFEIFRTRAVKRYGLTDIDQLQHALQSAAIAERSNEAPPMILACLFHDIGHMTHELGENPAAEGIDDVHERLGADYLRRFYSEEVSEPVRLHVAAKRYLVAVDRGYSGKLSEDSVLSLKLQGGPMTGAEIDAFRRERYWREAVRLRRIDELAKDKDARPPELDHYRQYEAQAR
jgi:predicted HD phosphohydrolase